jgi:hypothetical protein
MDPRTLDTESLEVIAEEKFCLPNLDCDPSHVSLASSWSATRQISSTDLSLPQPRWSVQMLC